MKKIKEGKENQKKNNKKILLITLLSILILTIAFIIYEIATVNSTYYIGEKNLQIPIFVYHDLVENEEDIKFDYMQTTTKQFEKQMTGLMKLGYKPITYQDLAEYKEGKKAIPKWSFIVTFDDGYLGVYKYAFEIAKKLDLPITSFEITDQVGNLGYYNWNQAREMKESGLVSIYLHGYSHIEYDKKTKEELIKETNLAEENLEKELNDKNILKVFTYPYGLSTEKQREELGKNGYIQNLTNNKINTSKNLDMNGLSRTYPLNDSVLKTLIKIHYRKIRYN